MLGTDDEDPEAEQGPDDGADALARAAEGASVTPDRLRGDEQYFPDCRPALQEDQQPHHAILLTTSGLTFEATANDTDGVSSTGTELAASSGGVTLLTEETLLAVVDEVTCEVPYGRMQGCLRSDRKIEIHGTGQVKYVFYVALSADDAEVSAGFGYLRRALREHD